MSFFALLPFVSAVYQLAVSTPRVAPPDTIMQVVSRPCATCRVVVSRPLRVGVGDSVRLRGALRRIARTHTGEWLVVTGSAPSIAVFSATGTRVRTVTPSVAPADSTALAFVDVTQGDTVHVIDAKRREHVVLAPGGTVVRRRPLLRPSAPWWNIVLLPHDAIVTTGAVRSPEAIGFPLHLMDSTGRVTRSFGTEAPEHTPEVHTDMRRIAFSDTQSVWMMPIGTYRLERWRLDGTRVARLDRTVPWFPASDLPRPLSPDTAPQARVLDLRQDARGLVWIAIAVPDTGWRASLVAQSLPNGRTRYASVRASATYDTIIEVLDPLCGTLLSSTRHDAFLPQFIDDGAIAEWQTGEEVTSPLVIWTIEAKLPRAGACTAGRSTPRNDQSVAARVASSSHDRPGTRPR